jgi:hypothetical protein
VYVAGGEIRYKPGTNNRFQYAARLWVDGVEQALEGGGEADGSGDMYNSAAYSVWVRNGEVYVAGYSEDADHARVCTIWKNGVKYAMPGLAGFFRQMAIDSAGAVYALVRGDEVYEVYGIAPDLSSAWPVVMDQGTPLCIAVDGTDFYAAGLDYPEAYYWKNGGRHQLPRPAGSSWAEARAMHVVAGGVNVAGVRYQSGSYYTQVWRDGLALPQNDPLAIKTAYGSQSEATPGGIFVK